MADYVSAYTGEDVDRAINKSLTEIDTKADKTQLSNRNLLDNAWFTVDQRQGYIVPPNKNIYHDGTLLGTTTTYYTVTGYLGGDRNPAFIYNGQTCYSDPNVQIRGYVGVGYTVDRWKIGAGNGTFTVNDSSVTVTLQDSSTYSFAVVQPMEMYIDKPTTVTVSALTKGTGFIQGWGGAGNRFISSSDFEIHTTTYTIPANTDLRNYNYCPCFGQMGTQAGTSFEVKAVKLEVGSISTLHLDAPPNYAEELLKCQRYGVSLLYQYGVGIRDANTTWVKFSLPTNIRPSMSLKNFTSLILATTNGAIHIGENQITDIGVFGNKDGNEIYLTISGVSLTQFTPIVAFNFCAFIDAEIY